MRSAGWRAHAQVMRAMVYLSIITNAALFAFTSEQLAAWPVRCSAPVHSPPARARARARANTASASLFTLNPMGNLCSGT